MHYRLKVISERVCCCMDAATGSVLTGIYTCLLSFVFLAVCIDGMVVASKDSHHMQDLRVINAVYGLLLTLSIIFAVGSVSLIIGAARKYKTYLLIWMVIAPLWTITAICQLIVLPARLGSYAALTNLTSRACGTAFIAITNSFCMFCVYLFGLTLLKTPAAHKLKSLGIVEALETGFASGYSRLRESIRPSVPQPTARYNSQAAGDPVTSPGVTVVLDPNTLEVPRSASHRKPSKTAEVEEVQVDVGESSRKSLRDADQLGKDVQPDGFTNVAFTSDI